MSKLSRGRKQRKGAFSRFRRKRVEEDPTYHNFGTPVPEKSFSAKGGVVWTGLSHGTGTPLGGGVSISTPTFADTPTLSEKVLQATHDRLVHGEAFVDKETAMAMGYPSDDALRAGFQKVGITQLRKLSRGYVSGGYSMKKPELIEALIAAGLRPEQVDA